MARRSHLHAARTDAQVCTRVSASVDQTSCDCSELDGAGVAPRHRGPARAARDTIFNIIIYVLYFMDLI